MEETISLKELFETLKKRIRLILSMTFIAVLISGVISYFFITPIYQASTQILVNQSKSNDQTALYNSNEVQTNLQLINTYNVIMKSPAILDKVAAELNNKRTTAQLNGEITVASETNSQVVDLTVNDSDAALAADIANKTAEVFQQQIVKIMNVNNVSILAKATTGVHPSPVKPKPVLNIAIGLVVGLMVGVGLAFLLEYLDNTIKTEQEIEKYLGLPVLGVIAEMDESEIQKSRKRQLSQKASLRGETIGS